MFTMDVEICPNNIFYLIFDLVNPSNIDTLYFFKAHRGAASFNEIRRYGDDSDMFDCRKRYSDLFMDLSTTDKSDQNFVPAHSVKRVFIPIEVSEEKFFDNPNNLRYYLINNNNDEYFFHLKHDDWANKLNANHNTISYPIFSNLEIQLWSEENKLYVASYSMAFDREKNENNYAGCIPNNNIDKDKRTCKDTYLRTCREGYGCNDTDSLESECVKCKKLTCSSCRKDVSKCTKCFPIAKDGFWNVMETDNEILCDFNFVDISKFKVSNDNNRINDVPPAIHFRVTMEFWIFVANPKEFEKKDENEENKFVNIIYKDFMVISFIKTEENNLLDVYCIPLEYIYKFPDDITLIIKENYKNFITNTLKAPNLNETIENSASKWFHVRCAYNIESNKWYLNNQVESILPVPQYYKGAKNKVLFHLKKFYKEEENTYLQFDRFTELSSTFIYLRNLNIFREYMPPNLITKYFNIHEFNYHSLFPQLLYSIPFDDVNENDYKFYTYNYFSRGTHGIIKDHVEIKDYTLILNADIENFQPPRTFQRLNLNSLNSEAKDCDIENKIGIRCEDNRKTCFEENQAYTCKENLTSPYYLNIFDFNCYQNCTNNYMRALRDTDIIQSQYCSKYCGENVENCPNEKEIYTSPLFFTCKNGFLDLYYHCYNEKDPINIDENVGMYFGNTLNSHTIIIPLKNEIQSYAISVWIHSDFRLRNYRYSDDPLKQNKPLYHEDILNQVLFLTIVWLS